MSSESDEDWQGQPADKEAEKQERIKAKNRRAQKRYREKKLHETDQYKLQASMHHTSLQCKQWVTLLASAPSPMYIWQD